MSESMNRQQHYENKCILKFLTNDMSQNIIAFARRDPDKELSSI